LPRPRAFRGRNHPGERQWEAGVNRYPTVFDNRSSLQKQKYHVGLPYTGIGSPPTHGKEEPTWHESV